MSSREQLAIVGLGVTDIGRIPGHSGRAFQAEAARLAIEDAGLKPQDIDGAILCKLDAARIGVDYVDAFPRILGLPVNFFYTIGRGAATVALSIVSAAKFLELGLAKYVVVSYGVNDWTRSRTSVTGGQPLGDKIGSWGPAVGDLIAVASHSMLASRHMYEFGTTEKHLGAVAVSQRQWALKNPRAAMYGKPLTMEDYLKAPFLVYPYRKFDMAQISDGGIAFVLTTAERAKDLRRKPVYVMGVGFGEHMQQLWWDKQNYTRLAVKTAKEAAFTQAGISLEDIDVAELYDCFTMEVIIQLEDYGWCAKGEGGPFVASGATTPGGKIPVNTGGGILAAYHMADFTGFSEAVTQLRGEAGERQVPDVEIVLTTGHGGEILKPGMCSIHTSIIMRR